MATDFFDRQDAARRATALLVVLFALAVAGIVLAAHPILSADWFREREVEFEPAASEAELGSADRAQQLSFDVTDLVADWIDGSRHNSGLLLKLSDDHEDYGVSGPSFPSSSFAHPAMRPQLEIVYLAPGT